MTLYVWTSVSLSNPQLVPASALLILRLLALLAMMSRACTTKVRWVSQVTSRILGVRFSGITSSPILTFGCRWDWWVSGVNKVPDDLWGGGGKGELLPARPFHQRCHKSVGLYYSFIHPGGGSHDGEVIGVRGHVVVGEWAVRDSDMTLKRAG